jgi:hypothetical protein
VLPQRLSTEAVALIVKIYAKRVGLDPAAYSGRSLRAGFLTSAAKHGATDVPTCSRIMRAQVFYDFSPIS